VLNNITMGQYLPTGSIIHSMDPRAKIIGVALAAIATIVSSSLPSVLVLAAWTVLVLSMSGIKPIIYWQTFKFIWVLLIISFLLQLIFTPGEKILAIGLFGVSRQGLISGGWMLWQITTFLLLAAVLTFTTTPLQLTSALDCLLSPLARLRVPVREISMTINLALRLVPTLFDEARHLFMAQRSRGADLARGGVRGRVKGLVPFMVPLLTNIFTRADELALAMEIRCYRVGAVRSRMNELRFNTIDYKALILSSLLFVFVLAQRIF